MNTTWAKNIVIIFSLAIAGLAVSCNNKPPAKSVPAGTTVQAPEKNPVVYINSDSLTKNYTYFKEMRDKFEEKSRKAQMELNSKGTAFQREVAEYQKSAQGLSADQRAATEERLARKQQELATYNQNASSALANEEATETGKLYDKLTAYLKTYAKQKGYKMVLTYSKANPTVLFADESLDITKEVIKGLNEAYSKDKK
jgi:outer membrane protein